MKKLVSILLIVAFLVQSTSQLWILVSFEINRKYIAANLCINRFDAISVCKGSCFLQKRLIEDQKQQQKFPDLKWKEINLFCQDNISDFSSGAISFNGRTTYPSAKTDFISSAFLRSVFRPPSFLS